jgi:hypothetical protein
MKEVMKKYNILFLIVLWVSSVYAQSYSSKSDILDDSVTFSSVIFPTIIYANSPVIVKGSFTNKGVHPIESIDITYQIDDNESVESYTLSELHIETGESHYFSHDVPVNVQSSGDYSLNVTLSNLNGIEEISATKSTDFSAIENGYVREVLLEEFSTENCSNCPSVGIYLSGIVEECDNVNFIVHHAGYYTDDYTIPENIEMLALYNSSTFAPAAMVDRNYNGLANDYRGTVNPGPVFWPGNPYGGRRIDGRLSILSDVNVNINGTYNEDTRLLTVDLAGEFVADFSEQLGVSVWITEDGIESEEQAGYSGTWTHHAVARTVLTATFGDSILTTTNIGDSYSASYEYTVPAEFVDHNLSIVAFVNRMSTDVNERDLLNSNAIEVSSLMQHFTSTFTVTDEDNNPIKNAVVSINDTDISTDESGNCEVSLFKGNHSYSIEKYGYGITSGSLTVDNADQTINVKLESQLKTTFQITDRDKNPLSRASVNVIGATIKVTDDLGTTEFMMFPETYSYTIYKDGFDILTGEFTLSDSDKIIDIELYTGVDSMYATFVVVDNLGKALADASVTVNEKGTKLTSGSGETYFKLIEGTYNYTVEKTNYKTLSGEFTLTDASKLINISMEDDLSAVQDNLEVFYVYPNPFKNELVISCSAISNAQATVFDISGKKIVSVNLTNKQTRIPTSGFSDGIYIVKIYNNNKLDVFKVVK